MYIIVVIPELLMQQRFPCMKYSDDENEFYKLTYGSGKLDSLIKFFLNVYWRNISI